VIGTAVAALVTMLLGLLTAAGIRHERPNGNVRPSVPVGPDGEAVTDRFYFVHQPLAGDGSITARVTSLTGIITYPPPNHDQIVPGVMPWAKAGVIVKESNKQGSAYAAMMLTGSHGVRMQCNFIEDRAGRPGGASAENPRWLRLTRSGDTLTGYESTDGTQWVEVGTAHLAGLPATVRVGLFVTSPGDLTVSEGASRFTQATAVFDQVSLQGNASGTWSRDELGADGVKTDWERFHRPAGVEESGGSFIVTGSGDIAPGADGPTIGYTLLGTVAGLIVDVIVAVTFVTDESRRGVFQTIPRTGRVLAAKAVVVGAVAFTAGLAAAMVAVALGTRVEGGVVAQRVIRHGQRQAEAHWRHGHAEVRVIAPNIFMACRCQGVQCPSAVCGSFGGSDARFHPCAVQLIDEVAHGHFPIQCPQKGVPTCLFEPCFSWRPCS
jgi:hypothetical protein